MLGHPKQINLWLASGPIALGIFLVGLFGTLWLPESLARGFVWLALVPAVAVLAGLAFALIAGLIGRVIR